LAFVAPLLTFTAPLLASVSPLLAFVSHFWLSFHSFGFQFTLLGFSSHFWLSFYTIGFLFTLLAFLLHIWLSFHTFGLRFTPFGFRFTPFGFRFTPFGFRFKLLALVSHLLAFVWPLFAFISQFWIWVDTGGGVRGLRRGRLHLPLLCHHIPPQLLVLVYCSYSPVSSFHCVLHFFTAFGFGLTQGEVRGLRRGRPHLPLKPHLPLRCPRSQQADVTPGAGYVRSETLKTPNLKKNSQP
jgi:hypothetical protein